MMKLVVTQTLDTQPATAGQGVLVCRVCLSTSIPMPAGATTATGFVCRSCSSKSYKVESLDRYQFEKWRVHRKREDPDGEPGKDVETIKTEYRIGNDAFRVLQGDARDIISRSSKKLEKAKKRGELWALNATHESIMRLETQQRAVFLLAILCELSNRQIVSLLHTSSAAVSTALSTAKRALVEQLSGPDILPRRRTGNRARAPRVKLPAMQETNLSMMASLMRGRGLKKKTIKLFLTGVRARSAL